MDFCGKKPLIFSNSNSQEHKNMNINNKHFINFFHNDQRVNIQIRFQKVLVQTLKTIDQSQVAIRENSVVV